MTVSEPAASIGRLLLELEEAQACRSWVRRRIETLSYRDEGTSVREVELTIDLSSECDKLRTLSGDGNLVPIPLLTLWKAGYSTTYSIEDASGRSLSHLDRESERQLISSAIASKIEDLYSVTGKNSPGPRVIEDLVVEGLDRPPEKYRGIWQQLSDSFWNLIDKIAGLPGEPPDTFLVIGAEKLRSLDEPDREVALALVNHWTNNRLLLAQVDPNVLGGPFVLRISYDEGNVAHKRPDDGPDLTQSLLRRALGQAFRFAMKIFRTAKKVLFGSLSWSDKVESYGPYRAATFHARIEAPNGFKVVGAAMHMDDPEDANNTKVVLADKEITTDAHIRFEATSDAIEKPSYLAFSFYAHRTGFVTEAAAVSLVVASLLLAFTLRLQRLNFDVAKWDAPFASAVVLFVPAMLLAVTLYKDGSRIASSAFAITRAALFLELLATFAAALPFAFQLSASQTHRVWYWIAIAGWIGCARVFLGVTVHMYRLSRVSLAAKAFRRRLQELKKRTVEQRRRLIASQNLAAGSGTDSSARNGNVPEQEGSLE